MSKPNRKPNPRVVRYEAIQDCEIINRWEADVLMALLRYTFGKKKVCWPAAANLAKKARMGESTLWKYVASLKKKGLLKTRKRSEVRADRATLEYEIVWEKLLPKAENGVRETEAAAENGVRPVEERGPPDGHELFKKNFPKERTSQRSKLLCLSLVPA